MAFAENKLTFDIDLPEGMGAVLIAVEQSCWSFLPDRSRSITSGRSSGEA
jgi:hypothetical protein